MKSVTKLARNRKAEAGYGTGLIFQTLIDFVIAVMIGLALLAYGSYLAHDQRLAQNFYSKDLALLMDAMMLSNDDLELIYYGQLSDNLKKFDYFFDGEKVEVTNHIKKGIQKGKEISKFYIHLFNPAVDLVSTTVVNPSQIYLVKTGNKMIISRDPVRSGTEECIETGSFSIDRDKKIFVDNPGFSGFENEATANSLYLTRRFAFSSRGDVFDSYDQSQIGIFVGLNKIKDNSRVTIYYPFGKKEFGCKLYNFLQVEEDGINVKLIPTASVNEFNELDENAAAVYIEVSSNNAGKVSDAIKQLIEDLLK